MITKNDWNDALDTWVEEERERLGGPPSTDEIVAYLSGELSGADAARIRALLVYYPELTPLLDERIEQERPRPSVFRRFALPAYAVAATVAIAVLTFAPARRDEPSVLTSHHELNTLRSRGPARVYELPGGRAQRSLITLVPSEPASDDGHDIAITRGSEVLWSRSGVRPIDGTFVIDLPGEFLPEGTYQLTLTHRGQRLETYTFRVTKP